jgi:hypothetical protein
VGAENMVEGQEIEMQKYPEEGAGERAESEGMGRIKKRGEKYGRLGKQNEGKYRTAMDGNRKYAEDGKMDKSRDNLVKEDGRKVEKENKYLAKVNGEENRTGNNGN